MLSEEMAIRLLSIWERLERDELDEALHSGRIYQRLEIGRETGFRLSCIFPDRDLELLLALRSEKEGLQYRFPNWMGMEFAVITLDVPEPGTEHISLRLRNHEYREIFISADGLKQFF